MRSSYPKNTGEKNPVFDLIETLSKGNREERLKAAKSLAVIKAPKAAKALVYALEDEDQDVRCERVPIIFFID
jgi:HEAT repeat protein